MSYTSFPPEIWHQIVSNLDHDSVAKVSLTCKSLYTISRKYLYSDIKFHTVGTLVRFQASSSAPECRRVSFDVHQLNTEISETKAELESLEACGSSAYDHYDEYATDFCDEDEIQIELHPNTSDSDNQRDTPNLALLIYQTVQKLPFLQTLELNNLDKSTKLFREFSLFDTNNSVPTIILRGKNNACLNFENHLPPLMFKELYVENMVVDLYSIESGMSKRSVLSNIETVTIKNVTLTYYSVSKMASLFSQVKTLKLHKISSLFVLRIVDNMTQLQQLELDLASPIFSKFNQFCQGYDFYHSSDLLEFDECFFDEYKVSYFLANFSQFSDSIQLLVHRLRSLCFCNVKFLNSDVRPMKKGDPKILQDLQRMNMYKLLQMLTALDSVEFVLDSGVRSMNRDIFDILPNAKVYWQN